MVCLHISIARSTEEMDGLAPLWNRLLRQQSHTLFQRFSWNRLAAEMFGDRLSPYVVSIESDAGATIIPAAINLATGKVQLLGEALFDYRDVLHAGDAEVLRQAWLQVASCTNFIEVVAVDSVAAGERWRGLPLVRFANAPQVDCGLTDENAFRLAHSRLGRQMRRLAC